MVEIKRIPVGKIATTGDNPRQEFDLESLKRLGDSIESHGLLQPIIVRPKEDYYELVVGERRLRAAQLLGMDEIEVKIEELDDATCTELRLIENTHREDLTDAEKGDAIYALIERYPERYPTIAEVARSINTSYGTVIQWTRKSRKLSNHVKELIAKNLITDGHAGALLKYDHATQDRLANAIVRNEIPTTLLYKFTELYDANPTADLNELAREAKGVKKVEVEIAELPKGARKVVEKIAEEREKEVEEARMRALEKARKAPRRRKPSKEEIAAVRAVAGRELEEVVTEEMAKEAMKRKLEKPKVIRGKAEPEVVVSPKLEELHLPYGVESELIKNIKNLDRQYLLGEAIKEQGFDEWETSKLIEFARERPDLSVERLVEGVKIESKRRKETRYVVLEIGAKLWKPLNAEAEKRMGEEGKLKLKFIIRELLEERLEELGHSIG